MDSIRSRILLFAVLATLLPSGLTLWISYAQSRRALEEKITQELVSQSTQTARALGVWLQVRLYDLRVFANSNEVSSNLGRFARGATGSPNRGRLSDYLRSLHERLSDFGRLSVVDLQGRVVATSGDDATPVRLAGEWAATLRSENQVVGAGYWDERTRTGTLTVAVPVNGTDGRPIGAFAAELNLAPLQKDLREYARDSTSLVFLMSASGALLASSQEISAELMSKKLDPATLARLVARAGTVLTYRSVSGADVVGSLTPVPRVRWAVVAEIPTATAFETVRRFRNIGLLVVIALLAGVVAIAYRFGHIIARPLDRLAQGANEVAAGNLAVDLPGGGGGEVGALTTVFNNMVGRLRESRHDLDAINETLRERNEELAQLSITDPLTALSNRRFLLQRLGEETARSRRTKLPYAVLMLDVDRFKQYNDAFGHPAGDEVLKQVASILRDAVRASDFVARYGGEEFCVLLTATSATEGMPLAERIRARIEATEFAGHAVTMSIGVASFPDDADGPDAVISAADEALYAAKRKGRNRVVRLPKANKKTTSAD